MGYIHLNKTLKDEILRMIGKFGRYMNFYGDQLDELLQREVDFNAMNTVMERVITLMHDKKDDVIFMMARGLRMRKIEPRLGTFALVIHSCRFEHNIFSITSGPRVANNRLMDNFKKETEEIINGVSKSFVYLTERTKKSLVEIRKRENSFETWLEQYERQLRQMIQEGAGFKTVKQTMEANIDHLMEKSIGLKDTIENGR